jgi:hypothetical protein
MLDYDELTWTTDFVLLPRGGTVADAFARLPPHEAQRAWMFVVAPAGDGRFAVARWVELEELTRRSGWNIGPLPLDVLHALTARADYAPAGAPLHPLLANLSFADLAARFRPVAAIDEAATSTATARRTRDATPGRRLPVTRTGTLVRLLTAELLSHGSLGRSVLAPQIEPPAPVLGVPPPERLPVPPQPVPAEGHPQASAEGPESAGSEIETRVINCWIELPIRDQRSVSARPIDAARPLLAGRTYQLVLDVDQPRFGATTSEAIGELADIARERELKEFTIALQLIVDDAVFATYGITSGELVVPIAGGASFNRVIFAFAPRSGATAGTLVVACSAFGQLFQELRLEVGITADEAQAAVPLADDSQPVAPPIKRRGRKTTAVAEQAGQIVREPVEHISLLVTSVDRAYTLSVLGAGRIGATIKLAPETVNTILKNVRATLKRVVETEHDGGWIYCLETTIPQAVHQQTVRTLALAGRQLFDDIFFHDQNDSQALKLGEELARFSRERKLDITVAADRFPIPWTLIYPGDDPENPDAELFWGFRHTIQYVPEFAAGTLDAFDTAIPAGDALPLAFVLDTAVIADNSDLEPVARHPAAVKELARVAVEEVQTRAGLLALLKQADVPPLLYFYTHAYSVQTDEVASDGQLGSGASYISVEGQHVTLQEMKRVARIGRERFASAPLLFLNACQGAEMDATQTSGLLTYFIALGARGAIGTEVDTPAVFAAEFGREFLARFTAGGVPLGALMRDLRREYLTQKNNVMGLVYALYASGDLRVEHAKERARERST